MKRFLTLMALLCAVLCMNAAARLTLSDLTGGNYFKLADLEFTIVSDSSKPE